jgi:serine/threonine-protein kinase HipA
VSAQTVRWGRPEVAQYSFIGSYQNVAKCLIEWVAAPREEQRELYRRIVFNALVGNLDDHDKNHGLIAGDDGSFRLSPVFDLSITARHLGREGFHELAMPFGEDGARISIDNLLSRSAEFGYPKEQAQDLIAFQWSVIRTGLIQKLVESGCPEAVADRTSRLMPGHSLFGHAHAANNPSKSSKGGDDVDGGHGEAEPLISTERKRPKQRKT